MTEHKTYFFSDVATQIKLRLKLMLSDKMTVAAFIIAAVAFTLVLNNLNIHADEQSAIPIGLVCEDSSELATDLVGRLKNVRSLHVYEGTFDENESLLLDGYISAVFVIKDGYGERVMAGETNDLLKLYFGKDDRTCAILGDIVAGEMMYEICFYGGLEHYHKLSDRGHTDAEYREYTDELAKGEEFSFSFDTEYINTGSKEKGEDEIKNSVLYRQMIAGMVAMLLSFVILFSYSQTVTENEQGIGRRKNATVFGKAAQIAGDLTAVLVCTLILCVLIAASTANAVGSIESFFMILLTCIGYVITMSVIMMLVSKISRSITVYQLVGGLLVLVFGGAGFASVFSGFMGRALGTAVSIIPNSIFIKLFTGAV